MDKFRDLHFCEMIAKELGYGFERKGNLCKFVFPGQSAVHFSFLYSDSIEYVALHGPSRGIDDLLDKDLEELMSINIDEVTNNPGYIIFNLIEYLEEDFFYTIEDLEIGENTQYEIHRPDNSPYDINDLRNLLHIIKGIVPKKYFEK